MHTTEAAFWSFLVMAAVAILALLLLKERIKRIIFKAFGWILDVQTTPPKGSKGPSSKTRGKTGSTDDRKPIAPPAPSAQPSRLPAWFTRHWLKSSISLVLILLLIVTPLWWWHCHSEAWKLVLSHHIAESWALWKQGPKATRQMVPSGYTLGGLTQLLDGYAGIQARDPHRVIEVWVVYQYWQYWTTDTFNDYTRANRKFIDSGGKIHRMFILSDDDLKNPQVTAVLRSQCEKIGADVWRGDAAAIGNKAEYQITAKAFEQMPYTETGFRAFDVLQLEDLTYYSSDFSPDYRAVGVSNWFYGQTLDLKPLFNKSVAQRIDCSAWTARQVAQTMQLQ